MISSESNFLIEIIENIPDKELQKQNNNKNPENNNQYSLKTVLDQFYKLKPIGFKIVKMK